MRRFTLILFALFAVSLAAGAQAMPSIMVVPSDSWCYENGFMQTSNINGITNYIPQYREALVKNPDLKVVISEVNGIMAENGYRLVDLESTLKNLDYDNALNSVTTKNGMGMAETPREALCRVAKADIILEVSWIMNRIGPSKSMTFTIRALDSYTQKEVASATGTNNPSSSVEIPVMLKEVVSSYFYTFSARLTDYFKELQQYGREITLEARIWEGASFDMYTDMGYDQLGYIIEDWVVEHSVGGMTTPVTASENILLFRGIRMPNATEEGRQIDARYWTRDLVKTLRQSNINVSIYTKGLGHILLVME